MSLSPRRNPAHTGSVPYSYSVVLKVTGTTLSYDSFWGAALTQPISSCSFAAAGPEVGDTLPLICPEARSIELISMTRLSTGLVHRPTSLDLSEGSRAWRRLPYSGSASAGTHSRPATRTESKPLSIVVPLLSLTGLRVRDTLRADPAPHMCQRAQPHEHDFRPICSTGWRMPCWTRSSRPCPSRDSSAPSPS